MPLFKSDRVRDRRPSPTPIKPPAPPPGKETKDETPPAASAPPLSASGEPAAPTMPASRPASTGFSRDQAAVIDKNTRLTGTLHSEGNVLIEGAFEGEIEAKETILVDKNAQSQGQLRANNVIISGAFDGQITCQNRFRVTPTGSIKGEINTSILVVEEGSTVNCRFVMQRERR